MEGPDGCGIIQAVVCCMQPAVLRVARGFRTSIGVDAVHGPIRIRAYKLKKGGAAKAAAGREEGAELKGK